jgi:RNA polymerase sigma-70 factor (ECF subfamily)
LGVLKILKSSISSHAAFFLKKEELKNIQKFFGLQIIPLYHKIVLHSAYGSMPMNESDAIGLLQKKIAANDQTAYRELFTLFYNKLFRFVKGFTKNKELTEEIVSDVFINIWKRRTTLEDISNLKLYLFISARNTTFNYLKKLHRESFLNLDAVDVEPEDPFADPGEALITREMNVKLKAAINALPPRCKLIFTLVKENGLTYKQTAQLLNISESTVDNQLAIALKKISGAIRYTIRHN